MAVGDRRQGGTNGLVDVASRGEVSPVLNEAHRFPEQTGELRGRQPAVAEQVQHRVAQDNDELARRGQRQGAFMEAESRHLSPVQVPVTRMGPEK